MSWVPMNECLMKEEMVSVASTAEDSVIEEWKGQVNVVSGKLWLSLSDYYQRVKWSEQVQD